MNTCAECDKPVEQPLVGRKRKYCSQVCRQAAWRAKKVA